MVKRTIPKRFQQLVKRLEHGSLASIANPSRPQLSIRTYYPGCLISLSILNNEWCIDVKNRDPDKISNKLIKQIFDDLLRPFPADRYRIDTNIQIDFKSQSVCLENWRDIHLGRIAELINHDEDISHQQKIGAFGFLGGQRKPERLTFKRAASEHPQYFEYIDTEKYSESKTPTLSLLDYKMRFKYVIDLPGHTYSTKLYWMLFLKRPLFLVPPRMPFEWESLLIPWKHYMPVKSDLSDLVDHFHWAENNPKKVAQINQNLYALGMEKMSPSLMKANLRALILEALTVIKN